MVYKVVIRDPSNASIRYLNDLKNFEAGKEFEFKPGVNIIIGENGSGKTTLMNLIKRYLLVDYNECGRGEFNSNMSVLFGYGDKILDGVDVYADYDKNTFRLSHAGEQHGDSAMRDIMSFQRLVEQKSSSTGEGVLVAMNSMFSLMFSKDAKLKFNYAQFNEDFYPEYWKYIESHRVDNGENEWTILMDEPDRNLDIDNISHIKNILSYHKENTQVIAVIHNPLLIYALSKNKHINWIELTKGYRKKVENSVKSLLNA